MLSSVWCRSVTDSGPPGHMGVLVAEGDPPNLWLYQVSARGGRAWSLFVLAQLSSLAVKIAHSPFSSGWTEERGPVFPGRFSRFILADYRSSIIVSFPIAFLAVLVFLHFKRIPVAITRQVLYNVPSAPKWFTQHKLSFLLNKWLESPHTPKVNGPQPFLIITKTGCYISILQKFLQYPMTQRCLKGLTCQLCFFLSFCFIKETKNGDSHPSLRQNVLCCVR